MPQPYPNPAKVFLNHHVLEVLKDYPTDGTHPYHWPKDEPFDGVTRDLRYQGELIARAEAQAVKRTYCCGLTFEVFIRACELYAKGRSYRLDGLAVWGVKKLKADWFVATGLRGGPVDALVPKGLGMRVETIEEAQAGDFVQLWRESGSGHSVIFLERVDGGIRYWSTQTVTNGIGERTEYFYGKNWVKKDELYIVRAFVPEVVV